MCFLIFHTVSHGMESTFVGPNIYSLLPEKFKETDSLEIFKISKNENLKIAFVGHASSIKKCGHFL